MAASEKQAFDEINKNLFHFNLSSYFEGVEGSSSESESFNRNIVQGIGDDNDDFIKEVDESFNSLLEAFRQTLDFEPGYRYTTLETSITLMRGNDQLHQKRWRFQNGTLAGIIPQIQREYHQENLSNILGHSTPIIPMSDNTPEISEESVAQHISNNLPGPLSTFFSFLLPPPSSGAQVNTNDAGNTTSTNNTNNSSSSLSTSSMNSSASVSSSLTHTFTIENTAFTLASISSTTSAATSSMSSSSMNSNASASSSFTPAFTTASTSSMTSTAAISSSSSTASIPASAAPNSASASSITSAGSNIQNNASDTTKPGP